jgi:hypothetical protein
MAFFLLVVLVKMTDCPKCLAPTEDILFASEERRVNQNKIWLLKISPKSTLEDLCFIHWFFFYHLSGFCQSTKILVGPKIQLLLNSSSFFPIKYVIELIFQGFHYHHKEALMVRGKIISQQKILLLFLSWMWSLTSFFSKTPFPEGSEQWQGKKNNQNR